MNAGRGGKGTGWKVEVEATCLRGTAAQVAESTAMDGRAGRSEAGALRHGWRRPDQQTASSAFRSCDSRSPGKRSAPGLSVTAPGALRLPGLLKDIANVSVFARPDPHPNPPGGRGAKAPRHPGEGRDPGHHVINPDTVIPAKAGTHLDFTVNRHASPGCASLTRATKANIANASVLARPGPHPNPSLGGRGAKARHPGEGRQSPTQPQSITAPTPAPASPVHAPSRCRAPRASCAPHRG